MLNKRERGTLAGVSFYRKRKGYSVMVYFLLQLATPKPNDQVVSCRRVSWSFPFHPRLEQTPSCFLEKTISTQHKTEC